MTYERFSELWDMHYTNRPVTQPAHTVVLPEHQMRPETKQALIEYGQGNTSKIDEVSAYLTSDQ